jgi:signal transduction histidine kinase
VAKFTVDTKLFQELGELLVAKESTALVELIKNAYDADATIVKVHGRSLEDFRTGRIIVSDDGIGMSADEFERGFLRIAGRTKVLGDRRSPMFKRRFTGEKGVGRLAAHKLATRLEIQSNKAGPLRKGATVMPAPISALTATIDWRTIEEELETFDEIEDSDAVEFKTRQPRSNETSGTRLTLTPLRAKWGQRKKSEFLNHAVTLTPASVLFEKLPKDIVREPLLFDELPVRDQRSGDPGFHIEFSGDLATQDPLTPDVAAAANWIAEVSYNRSTGKLRLAVSPTRNTLRTQTTAGGFGFSRDLGPSKGPSFAARILQRSGSTWPSPVQGIRVFMEGFRVSPYGDARDDWLGLERDYKSRSGRRLGRLSNLRGVDLPSGLETEELVLQGNAAHMGAVFLQRESSPELSMLVNREGFLPGEGLDFIVEWVRVATDLIVRLGYASRTEAKQTRQNDRERQQHSAQASDVNESPAAFRVRESALSAAQQLEIIRSALRRNDFGAAAKAAEAAQPHFDDVRVLSEQFGSEAMMWRVLASLGTELAAFVHEINAIGRQVAGLASDLEEALQERLGQSARKLVQRSRKAALELAERIRRNATYLVDATSFQGRRRRSRQVLRERFEAVVPFFQTRLAYRKISLQNVIPHELRTPPMFPAELSGIFTNLLSNAVKFTNEAGHIQVRARETADNMIVTIENTGAAVDLRTAPRFFEAFQSTTEKPDAVLGQGMGMGLTITRAFVHEYGGDIRFVPPSRGFATAITFSIPMR